MSADYPPGTVAMLRSPLGQEFMAVRTKGGSGDYWSAPTNWPLGVPADECDVRRLVVLDPRVHRFYPELLVRALRTKTGYTALADAIEAQTCPPKPPKPPEPTGLGAVVEDSEGRKWLRVAWSNPWCLANPAKRKGGEGMTHGSHVEWGRVDAVRVLSEGVQP